MLSRLSWNILWFQSVESGSPAFEAGLHPGDVLFRVNGTAVQGLLHVQVVSLILSHAHHVRIQVAPLASTTIKVCRRKQVPAPYRVSRLLVGRRSRGGSDDRRRHSSSLFRRLSNRKVEQLSSPIAPPNRSFVQFNRSLSSGDSQCNSPLANRSPTPGKLSDSSSSAGSTAPNSPASQFSRPSSLKGLKHKGLSAAVNRRQSWHNIPQSPLARTPNSSPMMMSPTRSPSPLIHPPPGGLLHPPGISNMTQTYNPQQQQQHSSPGSSPLSSSANVERHLVGGAVSCQSNAESSSSSISQSIQSVSKSSGPSF